MNKNYSTGFTNALLLICGLIGIFLGSSIALNPGDISPNGRLFFSILLAGMGGLIALSGVLNMVKPSTAKTNKDDTTKQAPTEGS